MLAIHQHFRLDDGNESGFLAQRGVASQRVRVGLEATAAGNVFADGDHRAPLGKTRAHLKIFRQTFAQSVQTFGDFFAGMSGHVFRASVHFDAGNDARIGEGFDKGRAVFLCWRMVSSKRIAPLMLSPRPGAVTINSRYARRASSRLRNAELGETFVAGGIAFVHRQQAFVVGDELVRGIN